MLFISLSEMSSDDEHMLQILSMHESKERSPKNKFHFTSSNPFKLGSQTKFLVLGEDNSTPFSDIARTFSTCALKYFQQIQKVVSYFGIYSFELLLTNYYN
jgi:hypothetical protein